MSITPLSSAALAQSSLFTTLADTTASTPTSLVTLLDPISTTDTTDTADSVFPDFPTQTILTASLNANLNSPTAADSSSDPNALTSLNQDFTTLLKDLASGDVSSSQSAVAKLQADLNAGSPTATSATSISSTSSSSSNTTLQNLLTSITSSLSTGDTTGALSSLANYFTQSGTNTTGTLLSTTV